MTDRRTQIMQAAVRVIARDGVRGLRVEKLAAEAGVSTALIYYHFHDRDGIVHAALEQINRTAEAYTEPRSDAAGPRERLESMLLDELQDADEVRTTSIAWGELRASAVFEPVLREDLRAATDAWDRDVASLIGDVPEAAGRDAEAIATRLTALVEGLSERWHSGSLQLDRARALVIGAVAAELPPAR
ncbi:TetR family transcriptional regulator C-terminal domain-containing protein [Tsukamurella tyrosinosolvens]|uniref:TetR/AcrR family transcriptional regulator n=1 Tax=Tsukamurella tyrosinosolvens TaxID=57704 RepID=UPI0007951C53|nr:TetR family transcriptional regulator C-terminal domain-containing protein [Tsukamurella tyrosinosolvens]KXP05599.1 TetR family transcriptional regulator [Tsukamurella tyrosinosolvens]KZL95417.1 TetR family transcriptional regulator [Tsukamurella tyrosinosolvens]MCA4993829.1 TetR family transcriptional regulator C-terminal domain-containing protein [Tsukamurella tyrosinosolvens]